MSFPMYLFVVLVWLSAWFILISVCVTNYVRTEYVDDEGFVRTKYRNFTDKEKKILLWTKRVCIVVIFGLPLFLAFVL